MSTFRRTIFLIACGTAFMYVAGFFPFARAEEAPCVDRAQCEQELAVLERQIAEHESTINKLSTQGKTLKSSIDRLNAEVSKKLLLVKAINLQIKNLDSEIVDRETGIKDKEAKLTVSRDGLHQSLRSLYENDQRGLAEMLLQSPRLSDFFGDVNNLLEVKGRLISKIAEITDLKTELENERDQLAVERSDRTRAKAIQDAERAQIEKTKLEKAKLLADTKGQESNFKKLRDDLQKRAGQIRNRLFQFWGGGEMKFEDALQFARAAEGATGVRPAFILAILDRESALGQNVGRCRYNQVNPVTRRPAMHPTRDLPYFLDLTRRLGVPPETIFVSCANSDGPYGGAMGPAQFIPSTWKMYEERLVALTDSRPPNPWNNGHAMIATGLYLKDAGAFSNEKAAAAKYYCGSRWNSNWVCLNVYGAAVVRKAAEFQEDIDLLKSVSA